MRGNCAREIQQQGYPGGLSSVAQFLADRRRDQALPTAHPPV